MRHLRTAIAVLAAITALGACTVAHPGTPKAGPSTRNIEDELGNTKQSDLRKVFTSSPQQVNDYWNSDRMKNAKPRDTQPGSATDVPKDEPVGVVIHPTSGPVRSPKPQPADNSGAVWSRAGLSASTNGRLYTSYGNQNFVCSAQVVNSTSGTIVATAAHCIWDTQDGKEWADNVMFIPGDTNGSSPYGRWTAEMIYAPTQFTTGARSGAGGTSGSGWSYDSAFLRMRPLGGRTIKDAVGGQGIAFDAKADSIRTIGYPSAPPFDGTTMRSCSSPTYTENSRVTNTISIPCRMTPGCSGGGWFTHFDDSTGAGYMISSHSTGNGSTSNGSLMGKIAYDLYKRADSGA
ncbi:trypsin-like serine peptidase [Allokutzneria albata]|uniref:V8-like Glu-specific endopeptidase n=1 Tax=Allokutzneria albata TaxID=211114 RepID=A0A1G9V6V9_ALLAB|nr:hypothetical protein [Allokutzneria albata]SDM67891.1 hypothetical protein SAMN04489726_2867 [Allokutzneria albata]